MKIAFIGQKGIPSTGGGVEKHVEDLAVRLADLGHKVIVYTRSNYTPKELKEFKGVELVNLPSVSTKNLDAISHTFLACLDLIFRRKVDVVHFHSIGPSSLMWLIKIFRPGLPIVATFHTQCYQHEKWGLFAKNYLKFGEFVCCTASDKLITVSKILKKYVKKKYHRNASYIPNGVNLPALREAREIKEQWDLKKDNYIISVSRLVRHKGIHFLIDAFKKIKTDKKLVIVGDGSFTDEYVDQLKKMALDDPRIIFTGNQSGRVLEELFSNAYLFVQPSQSEGLSIALLEAMSYERPVLVSDIPENTDVIEDCGFVFKNGNVADLRKKLEMILGNPELAEEKGQLGRQRAKDHFSWDNITEDIVNIYESLVYKKVFGRKSVEAQR